MIGKVLTDSVSETVKILWDGERFALTHWDKDKDNPPSVIILNPAEMLELIEFVGEQIGGK